MQGSRGDFTDTFASNSQGWRGPFGLFCRAWVSPVQSSWGVRRMRPLPGERADVPVFLSCHSGYVGARCEHADLLAVVAASQKKQAITALVVVSIVALAVLIITCVLIQ